MASSPDILDELPWLTPAPRTSLKTYLRRHGRSVLLLAALGAPLLIANGHFGGSGSDAGKDAVPADTATPSLIDSPFAPKALRPLSPIEAERWNSAVPVAAGSVEAATPFAVNTANAQATARSMQCMTQAIYYEAGNEPVDGQRAVAQVILNRLRSPVFPHSVCGVVYQGSERKTGCQFTFTCDGSLARAPSPASWARASAVAAAALGGYVFAPVGWATNYHADYVVPYWAQSLQKLTTVGRHIFYGWKGASGSGSGFNSRYAGIEPDIVAGLGAVVAATTATAIDPSGGIVRVTSADRPMIDFGAAATAAPASSAPTTAASAEKTRAPAAEPEKAPVAMGARWVIGGSPSTGSARLSTHSAIPLPTPERQSADTAPASAPHESAKPASAAVQ